MRPSPYVRCSSLLTILMAFCSTCCSSSVSGEPKLSSIWFSVIYQLAGNAFYLSPQLGSLRGKAVLAAISKPEEHYLWPEVCRNLASFTEVSIPQLVPLVDALSGITDYPSSLFRGTNCTSQSEISKVPITPWRLRWAGHLNPSHFHYYIFFDENVIKSVKSNSSVQKGWNFQFGRKWPHFNPESKY